MSSISVNATKVDLTALPTSEHLTLLFRYGRSTTLLSVLPTQPFPDIREMLLAALKSRNITTFPGSSIPLPDDANQIQLGVLKDKKDTSKGWTPLIIRDQQNTGSKSGKKKAGAKNEAPNESPAGVGLTDGSSLAYRIAVQPEDDEDDLMLDVDDDGWNVVLPSYEEEDAES